jgi:hypothetical protein
VERAGSSETPLQMSMMEGVSESGSAAGSVSGVDRLRPVLSCPPLREAEVVALMASQRGNELLLAQRVGRVRLLTKVPARGHVPLEQVAPRRFSTYPSGSRAAYREMHGCRRRCLFS